jgi:hypothetical protein
MGTREDVPTLFLGELVNQHGRVTA